MKILVFSDSHGSTQPMIDAVYDEAPDCIVHLGDHIRDAEQLSEHCPNIPIFCVSGNCDYMGNDTDFLVREIGGVRFFITHGHKYGVKADLTRLSYAAMENGAAVALFGHTHSALLHKVCDRVILFNPGSCRAGIGSYGVIHTGHGTPTFHFASIR